MQTQHYNTAILPIINTLTELDGISFAPSVVDLVKALNQCFLTSISIKQTELGSKVTQIIGGALILQTFLIMQSALVNKKVILIVDEVSIVQNPALIQILSEARKFGLTVILTQQYLMQVSANILQSILANTVNYFCFKVGREDSEVFVRNVNFEIDELFLKNKNDPRESQELAIKMLTDLNPRELIMRVMSNDQYCPPIKVKTLDI